MNDSTSTWYELVNTKPVSKIVKMNSKIIKKLSDFLVGKSLDECINFPVVTKDGYGIIYCKDNGKKIREFAHRISYFISNGCIPIGQDVIMHKCDNPPCVNPNHLQRGSHADNVADRQKKGRQAKGVNNGRYKHGNYSIYDPVRKDPTPFEGLCRRSLTLNEVHNIKSILANRGSKSLIQVSQETGIKHQTLKDISAGRTYK